MKHYFCLPEASRAHRLILIWFALWIASFCAGNAAWAEGYRLKETFPRLMGMNISTKNYDDPQYQQDLAKMDVVIVGFNPYWRPSKGGQGTARDVVKRIKSLNPAILIGHYSILTEAHDNLGPNLAEKDKYYKLHEEDWWLRDSSGQKVQWTGEFGTKEINITQWAPPDKKGKRYPEWVAERDFNLYFNKVPEFDIWYFDGVSAKSRIKRADWNRDGIDESRDDPHVAQAYREANALEFRVAKQLAPNLIQLGNADTDLSSPEYKGQLGAAFIEGAMGWKWSLEAQVGWQQMMKRYRDLLANTAEPHLVGFNVAGAPGDYRLFRYGFTSCLLDEGYFSYSDKERGYSTVPWFDEYNVDLGRAIDQPQTKPWQKGIYRRVFENGMVLVNPNSSEVTVTIGAGYRSIDGIQDRRVNHGQLTSLITLGPKDGIVLIRTPKPN